MDDVRVEAVPRGPGLWTDPGRAAGTPQLPSTVTEVVPAELYALAAVPPVAEESISMLDRAEPPDRERDRRPTRGPARGR